MDEMMKMVCDGNGNSRKFRGSLSTMVDAVPLVLMDIARAGCVSEPALVNPGARARGAACDTAGCAEGECHVS